MLPCCLGQAAHGMPSGCCAGRAVVAALALLLSHAACEPNASVQHVTYDAADLSVAKQALSDGQELQDLLHWAICAPPAPAHQPLPPRPCPA